jgi:hypothetical protein
MLSRVLLLTLLSFVDVTDDVAALYSSDSSSEVLPAANFQAGSGRIQRDSFRGEQALLFAAPAIFQILSTSDSACSAEPLYVFMSLQC